MFCSHINGKYYINQKLVKHIEISVEVDGEMIHPDK